jgi:hypothetical protein
VIVLAMLAYAATLSIGGGVGRETVEMAAAAKILW